jgi:hypothetical protein
VSSVAQQKGRTPRDAKQLIAFSLPPGDVLLASGAESARDKDNQSYQEHQANTAAADDGASEVKPAAADQKKNNKQNK